MYRLESSGPYSGPVNVNPISSRPRSKVCEHRVNWQELMRANVQDGELVRVAEYCCKCQVRRYLTVAQGEGAERFLLACEQLALPAFEFDPDVYSEHEFWIAWTTRGPDAAFREALEHGHAPKKAH